MSSQFVGGTILVGMTRRQGHKPAGLIDPKSKSREKRMLKPVGFFLPVQFGSPTPKKGVTHTQDGSSLCR